jgi:hypothetical protein
MQVPMKLKKKILETQGNFSPPLLLAAAFVNH